MIEVESLWYRYEDGTQALRGVNLYLDKGEKAAIVGENGAGKTTLVKHLNGLLKPQMGIVRVDGLDVSTVSVATIARKVGFVFQNPDYQLFAETVEEEVGFALKNFGFASDVIKGRVEHIMKLLDLEPYRHRSPFSLSDGERKRVALAAVLSYDPEVLIFDEPTVGQDYGQKAKLAEMLAQLSYQGKTLVVVTHDIEFVAENFSRLIVMAKGKVLSDGNTRELLSRKDVLEEARLLPPQMMRLASMLTRYGIPQDILTVPEMVQAVRRWKKREV